MQTNCEELKVNVMVSLKGDDAVRFMDYKRRQTLRANAEAGYKLMFERLAQVEAELKAEAEEAAA